MRFGYKIFLMAFLLVIITTTGIGIVLINNSYKINMDSEIDKNITEIMNINSTVNSSLPELSYLADNYLMNKMYTEVYNGSDIIFTNFKDHRKIEEILVNSLTDSINSYIEDGILYMAYKEYYTIITKTDISDVILRKEEQIAYFTRISMIISFTLALILSLIVSFMTNRMKKLKRVVKEIEKGNYTIEVPKVGKDEIGDFATSIASMANSIDKNIKEIESISEARKIFIGNLTHEIRTPLTSIIGYSSLIKNNKINDIKQIKSYSFKIYEEGKYIESMRDKLMNILTLDQANIELIEENISVVLLKHIDELKRIYSKTKFIVDITKDINKKIDATLFRSLVFNLVKNGIEASTNPEIKITLNKKKLIIEDNGHGIKEEDLEKIKEPFYTTNKDRNRESSGMGLGLTLCCNIISIHNWNLEIKSTPNHGTKMIIHLGGIS